MDQPQVHHPGLCLLEISPSYLSRYFPCAPPLLSLCQEPLEHWRGSEELIWPLNLVTFSV